MDEAQKKLLNNQVLDDASLNLLGLEYLVTIDWLERLYKHEEVKTLRFIVQDIDINSKDITLDNVDSAIRKYMGGNYCALYSNYKENAQTQSGHKKPPLVDHPYDHLLIWAVLTKRQTVAKLVWKHGNGALAKALATQNLYRAMAIEAEKDGSEELELANELKSYAEEFGKEAGELLDYCYHKDSRKAKQLLVREMPNWSYQTCLELAFRGRNYRVLSHQCAQLVLEDLWLGGLSSRRHNTIYWKIFLFFILPFLPFLVFPLKSSFLEFKSKRVIESSRLQRVMDEVSRAVNYSGNRDFQPRNNQVAVDTEKGNNNQLERGKQQQPGWWMKIVEFYTAPATKYLSWSLAYFVFLGFFTYTLLIRTLSTPAWNEWYVVAYLATFALEKFRQLLASLINGELLRHWIKKQWNCCDVLFIAQFLVGLILRLNPNTLDYGRLFYCLNIVYWYIRVLAIFRVSKFLGPILTMIGKMLEKMIYYVSMLLVMVMSYGVFRQSLLFPNEKEFSWLLVRDIFFKPYFMIYGELFVEEIDPPCGDGTNPDMPLCVPFRWFNPLLMTFYLMVVCILMVNLLIAVFNSVYNRVAENSERNWKFNRYDLVMEYQKKPPLPPPFVVVSHFILIWELVLLKFRCYIWNDEWEKVINYYVSINKRSRAVRYLLTKDVPNFENESVMYFMNERQDLQKNEMDERMRLKRVEEKLDKIIKYINSEMLVTIS